MADKAHIATDKQLEQMEKHLRQIYKRAAKELEEKMRAHLEQFPIDDEKMKKAVDAGEMTQKEYRNWRQKQVMLNRHYKRMEKQIASDISQVNVQAQAYINDQIPKVYATNYNYTGNDIKAQAKKMGGGYSFTLANADTVKNLATKDKTLLPYKYVDGKKDVRWNTKKVNSEILQGILQGESIPKIAKRMENVVGMDYRSAVSSARTCVTSSENKGRLDGLYRAREKGVIMQKGWLATNDSRTRDSHAAINGTYVDIDEDFPNGLQYPADPEGAPAEVYNCRCTLVTKVVGFDKGNRTPTIDPVIEGAYKESTTGQHVSDKTILTMFSELGAREKLMAAVTGTDAKTAKKYVDATQAWGGNVHSLVRKYQQGRTASVEETQIARQYAIRLERMVSQAPEWTGGTTYRGTNLYPNEITKLKSMAGTNQNYNMRGMASWSSKVDVAEEFTEKRHRAGKEMVIYECPTQQNGTSIMAFSNIPYEYEVLVSETSNYVVDSIVQDSKGIWRIRLKEKHHGN